MNIDDEKEITINVVPAGYTVVLDGEFYGIGATIEAAYAMARNDRSVDTWKALV